MKRNPLLRHLLKSIFVALSVAALGAGCASRRSCPQCAAKDSSTPAATSQPSAKQSSAEKPNEPAGLSLFDGKTMGKWVDCNYAGGGEPIVENGNLIIPVGERLTGIRWAGGDVPTVNYEISLQGKRIDGSDFFCGLTFPVGDSSASLILGGWGGALCGISSIDGDDAAHNDFKTYATFDDNKWYDVRLRVTPDKILVWLDQKQIIEVPTEGKKFSLRGDIEESKPLGIATFQTTAAIREIRLKRLSADGAAAPR